MLPHRIPLLGILLLAAVSGCVTTSGDALHGASVALRPDGTPGFEECPAEAKKAMRYLKIHVGDATLVDLDANQLDSRQITLYDGPVESMLRNDLGLIDSPARLYGYVWTAGPQVVIRYYEAHPARGDKIPICAVARLSQDQMKKRPESLPGTAILDGSVADAYVVDAFR